MLVLACGAILVGIALWFYLMHRWLWPTTRTFWIVGQKARRYERTLRAGERQGVYSTVPWPSPWARSPSPQQSRSRDFLAGGLVGGLIEHRRESSLHDPDFDDDEWQ